MARGRSVRLYLAEGTATGIITAEIINWTGHVLSAPRTRLDAALQREEMARTGVYLLLGSDGTDDLPAIYVGEGDSIRTRIRSHAQDNDKDFWDRFIAITSKDLNLTKAHVRYLESALITLLAEARKTDIRNRSDPGFDRLPEADVSDMKAFLDEIQLILPVIGVDYLKRPHIVIEADPQPLAMLQRFTLHHPAKGIRATAVEADGEFVVLTGSTGSLNTAPSFNERSQLIRDQALDTGRAVRLDDRTFRVEQDIAFTSPSAASVFLFGTGRNGRIDWKVEGDALTYGDYKDRQLA